MIQKAILHRLFPNIGALARKINDFVEHDNTRARSLGWVATAESILVKLEHLCKAISRMLYP